MTNDAATSSAGAGRDFRFALCLSGGGFRATFFHLGVVRFLRDIGALGALTDVFGVSGGSILAGHLAVRWKDYANHASDEGFHRASSELIQFAMSDLRGRIVRRWLLLGWALPPFARTQQLERHYARLYRGSELGTLPEDGPDFRFLGTSLSTGECCVFSRTGYSVLGPEGAKHAPATDMPLARAVAASSAFPPLFPALPLDPVQLHVEGKEKFGYTDRVVDGGVFDNTGIHALRRELRDKRMKPVDFIIVSDASASFDSRFAPSFSGLVARNVRAGDVLMSRVAELVRANLAGAPPTCWLSLHDIVEPNGADPVRFRPQDAADQAMLTFLRTDLDAFTLTEIRALVKHGYEVAHKFFDGLPVPPEPWDPCPPGWPDYTRMILGSFAKAFERVEVAAANLHRVLAQGDSTAIAAREKEVRRNALDAAATRRTRHLGLLAASRRRVGLWNPSDWASYALAFAAFAGLTSICGLVIWAIRGF